MEKQGLIQKLLLSSIPVRVLNADRKPEGFASGAIVTYRSKKFFITVEHGLGDKGDCCFEVRFNAANQQTLVFEFKEMGTLFTGNLFSPTLEKVDFAYKQILPNVSSNWQKVSQSGEIEIEILRPPNELNFHVTLEGAKEYGFAGIGCAELRYERYSTGFLHHVFPMTYLGIEKNLAVFKFDPQFNDNIYYEGCSGAPILDSDGNLVALVEGGDHKAGKVYGVPLRQFRTVFDIECGLYG